MEKNVLNKYLLEAVQSLEYNLNTYAVSKKPEYLHHVRVDIKKIRALFSFAGKIYKETYDTKKLKSLFRSAGKIREMHIHIQLLSKVPHTPERLMNLLREKENVLIQQFIKNASRRRMLINDLSKKASLPEKRIGKKSVRNYFDKEKKKAANILQRKDRLSMHMYRKNIKKMMYIYNALPEKMREEIELNNVEIDKLQIKLGNWHDTYSALQFLYHARLPIKTSEHVLMLKEKEKRQFNSLLNSLKDDRIL